MRDEEGENDDHDRADDVDLRDAEIVLDCVEVGEGEDGLGCECAEIGEEIVFFVGVV